MAQTRWQGAMAYPGLREAYPPPQRPAWWWALIALVLMLLLVRSVQLLVDGAWVRGTGGIFVTLLIGLSSVSDYRCQASQAQ